MVSKLTFTIHEIAAQVGVSHKTVRRKMEGVKEYLQKDKRKRFYTPTEVEFIKSLFHSEVTGL